MAVSKLITERLERSSIQYQLVELPDSKTIKQTAKYMDNSTNLLRSVAFKSSARVVVAVLPYNSLLDYKIFEGHLDEEFTVLDNEATSTVFKNSIENSYPLIPEVFDFRMVIDPSILNLNEVFIQSGDPAVLIQLDKTNANLLFNECESFNFATSPEALYAGREINTKSDVIDVNFTQIRLKQRVDETFDLPAMPDIAQDIMKLRVDPSADASKLAQIVRRDPSLATQVISWASSPYYGYQGKIDSVETAIARVLGFELVMNLALGISIGKSLKVPMEGPLGVKEFWKQSIYSANLAEKICRAMPIKQRPERGLIYLSGLLHNFGHLLLGHLFPPQFKLVNITVQANPYIAVEDIEFYILGVTHEEIGAWLMKNWHMPEELIVAVHRHHQEEFWSKHSVYSNIVLIANRLLKRINIGDAVETEIPATTLDLLSLEESVLETVLADIQSESEVLDVMAKQLVA